MEHYLFLHAHPDDEAIFTGGTIAILNAIGVPSTVVIATTGDTDNSTPVRASIAAQRQAETERACAALGGAHLEFLGYCDSGIGDSAPQAPAAFVYADVEETAIRVAEIARSVGATALVFYDDDGIYGHLDHLKVHAVGRRAAIIAGIATTYQATVDREYLHFVDTHLVGLAALALGGGDAVPGVPTALISTTIRVGDWIEHKRTAMAAHASQIPADSVALGLDDREFDAVYGYEWYIRSGPPTRLDQLGW